SQLPVESGDSPGERQSGGWKENFRVEELRGLPRRSFQRRTQSFTPRRIVLHNFHDLDAMAARPAHVEGDGSPATRLAEAHRPANVGPDRFLERTTAAVNTERNRQVLALLSSHWLAMLGAALVTTAGFSWLFVLPMQVRGNASNPYIGLVVFIAIPVVF